LSVSEEVLFSGGKVRKNRAGPGRCGAKWWENNRKTREKTTEHLEKLWKNDGKTMENP
jgi:hypothetical protein